MYDISTFERRVHTLMTQKKIKILLASFTGAATVLLSGVTVNAEAYIVKAGDTLSSIANENNTTVDKLVEQNKLTDADKIFVNQRLELNDVRSLANKRLPRLRNGNGEGVQTSTHVDTSVYQASTEVTYSAPVATGYLAGSGVILSNGNSAGETGSYAAARMAELTGVSASIWENIIARESNGQVNAYNSSGASGLFQTMPGWGSTATVDDQIAAAQRAYNAQGLSAWNY